MDIIKINNNKQKIIDIAVQTLKQGGLVIYPTETVYGIGIDATNPEAVKKLLRYKSRREGKPLSIAVSNQKMAENYVNINDQAQQLYKTFLPGPMTIISNASDSNTPTNKYKIAHGVKSEFETIGIRIPDYPLIIEIIKKFGKPITATSANSSGKKRPYTIQDIFNNISNKQKNLIDLIIDAGKLPPNNPSTIIDTTLETPITLREGDKSPTSSQNGNIVLHSNNENDTKGIAGRLMLKNWDKIKKDGLIIGLDGPLGAGKTIFAKGIAKFLKIEEVLTSPTYSYINEYIYNRHNIKGKLFHLDVWKIDSKEEFEFLEFEKLIAPHNIVVVEWWTQVADYAKQFIKNKPFILANFKIEKIKHKIEKRTLTIYDN